MAQLLVRNLENEVKSRLKRRASRHGRSMEEEAREILRDALRSDEAPAGGLGTEIAALFRTVGLVTDIPEFRSFALQIPDFSDPEPTPAQELALKARKSTRRKTPVTNSR